MVACDKSRGASFLSKVVAKTPPMIEPVRNNKFHFCVFQSKLKKLFFFPAPARVHNVLKFEEKPKDLPKLSNKTIIKAIAAPDKYQDQGCLSKTNM